MTVVSPDVRTSVAVRQAYDDTYYLEDCGGFATYTASGGKSLDPRLECMARLAFACHAPAQIDTLRVLDLGCGRGELTRYFAALGAQVEAIDYSEAAVRLAEACFAGEPQARARTHLHCGSVTDAALWQGLYDLILASDLIEHLAPEENARLYELAAMHLNPSGCLILHSFPNLWYYRYGHPMRRRTAAVRGEALPAEPRTQYELAMHINEQSPRILRRQLQQAFPQVLLWAGDHQTPAGSLARPFSKSDWYKAPSLFAIAAQHPLEPPSVIAALARSAPQPEPLPADAAITPAPPNAMLLPNNPEIDFPALNARIQARLERLNASPPAPRATEAVCQATALHVDSLPALMALDDLAFIEQAHLLLRGVLPDPPAREQGLHRIRAGEEKGEILARIVRFSGGKTHNPALYRQLRANRIKHWLARKPVIGGPIRSLFALLRAHPFRVHVNAKLNQLSAENQALRERFNRLDALMKQASAHLNQHDQRLDEADAALRQSSTQLNQHLNDANATTRQVSAHLHQHDQRLNEFDATTRQVSAHLHQHDQRLNGFDTTTRQVSAHLSQHDQRLNQLDDVNRQSEERWKHLEAQIHGAAEIRHELPGLKRRIAELGATQAASPVASESKGAFAHESSSEDQAFYVAFEDRFRGDPAKIEQRLGYYLPLLRGHSRVTGDSSLKRVDLGCGRGEWLNVLQREALDSIGIDLNPHNISHCQALGHNAIQADALTWLSQQPPGGFALITAFHLIEHLPFATLHSLLAACACALAPGGLLIFETPNPENLLTSATSFYLDPTHRHPLPPALTEFLLDYHGFSDIQLHRLNPIEPGLQLPATSETAKRCNQLFYGPQDYAVSACVPQVQQQVAVSPPRAQS